ncbi:MAG: site-2 protease family protein [Bacteroidota bacterium]|nr:site-2 protease family protein [Bacteroidota bacterium]
MISSKTNFLRLFIHTSLFSLTFFTTTLAGVQWLNKDPFELSNFSLGLPYSISILLMLSAHEFGHYFAARYHNIDTTLPYYIPAPPFLINPFGTMGAVIRIRSTTKTALEIFDIGIVGPIAGFIVTVGILFYGLFTLPGTEYLFNIHPEYRLLDQIPEHGFSFGNSLLFFGFSKLVASNVYFPPMNEIYHYPYLCVGWFGLFVTSLNLMPVGQLDGGHILYALVGGKKQRFIARLFFYFLISLGLISIVPIWQTESLPGSAGWLLWAAILYFLIKLNHPEIPFVEELTPKRKILGWITFLIFILTFTPVPFLEY